MEKGDGKMMIEIRIPKIMREFGYELNMPTFTRRESLGKMLKYQGKDSLLFNMSSAMFLYKKNKQLVEYNKLRMDLKWMLDKYKML